MGKVFSPCLVVALMSGCGSRTGAPMAGASSADLWSSAARLSAKTLTAADLTNLSKVGIGQYYGALLAQTTDEPFVLNHQTIAGAHSALMAAAPLVIASAIQFGSLGALLKEAGSSAATTAELNADISEMAQAYAHKSAMFAMQPSSLLTRTFSKPNATLATAQTDPGLRNFAALELISGLARSAGAGLSLDVGTGACPSYVNRAYVYLYRNPPMDGRPNGVNKGVGATLQTFGHISTSIQTSGPGGTSSTTFISKNGRPNLQNEDYVFGPRDTIAMPPMTDDQVAAWNDFKNTADYAQINSGDNYNAFTNNCANAVAQALQGAGYSVPVDPNQWLLTPIGLFNSIEDSGGQPISSEATM